MQGKKKQKCAFLCVILIFWLTKGPETKPKEKKKDLAGSSAPQTIFTKKERATLNEHFEILNWYHTNRKNQKHILIQGNDRDHDVDNDASIESPPMPQEVHLAALVINWYVYNINDPLTQKLEGVLASFSHQ